MLVHALEMTNDPAAMLREVWRVLAGGGRLLVVVPNRRGLWARMDTTPFGHGRPYSRSQINQLLRETWFTPTGWGEALYMPPVKRGWFLRSAGAWERTGYTLSALVDEAELPLPDNAVDRVLLVHALEMTNDPGSLLREVWRVLAGGGRLLAVVPNRRGLWARMDTTPFGHGRPYSRTQINQLLRETWFTPTGWSEALYVPPVERGWFLRSAGAWERTGYTLSAPFAGVHLVEAGKQVYRAIPARRVKRRLVPALEPALAPSPGR
jgi:SAM-dependent methyltransferase